MAYRAQMVIRTKDPRSADILDAVKKLAEKRGQTISQLAISLFEQGLNEDLPAPGEATSDDDGEPVGTASLKPKSKVEPEPVPEVVKHVRSPETKEIPRLVVVPNLGDEQTEHYATRAIKLVVTEGVEEGAAVLLEFFASASPVQAGQLREELQKQLREKEFVEIFDLLRETDEYRGYRKRVIYG